MNREAIFSALFQLLNEGLPQLNTISRVLLHWDDVSPNQQPALFMTMVSQSVEQTTGFPSKYLLEAKLWIYTHRDTAGVIPSAQINQILDALDAALKPAASPLNKQTLGGLVEHCWIDGEIATDEGTLGNQAVATVPIRMLVVAS